MCLEEKFNTEKKKSSKFLKKLVANQKGLCYAYDRFKEIELKDKRKEAKKDGV
jgi:hypothetical protein